MPEAQSQLSTAPGTQPEGFPWRPLLRLAWPWAAILAAMLAVNLASLWIDGAVRVGLAGGMRWSQSEKEALKHLRQYIRTGEAREHAMYRQAMAVPLAVDAAHDAFARRPPDYAEARRQLAVVLPQRDDAASLVLAYRVLGGAPQFAHAIESWDRAHRLVRELATIEGEAVRMHAQSPADAKTAAWLESQSGEIEERLDEAAEAFGFGILNGARQLRNYAQGANATMAALLLVFGLYAAGQALSRASRATRNLRIANDRFELAVGATNDGIWDWDIPAGTLTWTQRLREQLGFESDADFAAYEMHRNVHPDDSQWALEARRRHLSGELERLDLHLRLRCRSGEYRWFHLRSRAIRDATGRAVRLVGMLTDMHEQRMAQEAQLEALRALRKATAELELAIDAGQVALWSFDPRSGKLLNIRRWDALIGPVPMPATFDEWQQMVHPDDRSGRSERLQRYLRREAPTYESEFRMRNAQGKWLWLRSRGCVTRVDAAGEALEYAGAVMDVTKEIETRETQREQYEFLQAMIEGIESGVMLSSPNRVHYVNESMCRMLGFKKEELVGRRLETLAPDPRMRDLMMQRRVAAMAGRVLPLAVVELLNARGEPVPFTASLTHVQWHGTSHFVSTFTPLLEHERLRERLQAAQARFERILVGELETQQAHIARELHDSLGSVLAGLSLLIESAKSRAPAETGVDEILEHCQEQVLLAAETSRSLARGLMPVGSHHGSLQDALEQFVQDLESVKGVAAELVVHADLSDITASAGNHIYRIVQEAVSNSLRHGKATAIRVTVDESECSRTIGICDNGSGFDPDALPRSHSGMGLRSMQARAQSVGARVVFERPPSGGFLVNVVLPRAQEESGSAGHAEAAETTW